MRFTDGFRRRVIQEVHFEAVLWGLSHPSSHSYGARSHAWHSIAYKLNCVDYAIDLRRMWRGWLLSYVKFRLRETQRQPKYYKEMHFLHNTSTDNLLSLKYRF
ncbi:hypothetical protein AAVH_26957 [Aphelenchoides avenae]|nr:hypothetical protein AAVH_26957 [Aphelenchus avenae]